jgi:hypothetical protein
MNKRLRYSRPQTNDKTVSDLSERKIPPKHLNREQWKLYKSQFRN